jgi:uracil permease
MVSGYILCCILKLCGLETIDYSNVVSAPWINLPYGSYYIKDSKVFGGIFQLPTFDGIAIATLAPVALVTFMEHIGDITTNGKVVGKDFFADPGLHRTILGDGVASIVAGFLGGPASTTYSENTGVLATTKNYGPIILRLRSLIAIVLGLFGKFGSVLLTIPVKSRVLLVLFYLV